MKFLVLLFLAGFASASLHDVLDQAADDIMRDFVEEMELNPLKTYMAMAETDDEEIKTELGKRLKEHLDKLLEQVDDAVGKGKEIKEDVIKKIKDIREKLKDLKVEIGDRAKELLEKIKEKAKDYWQKILDRLGLKDKDTEESAAAFNLREKFEQIKKAILAKIDKDALKEKIEEYFRKGSELADQLLDLLKEHGEKGKQRILDFIDRHLEDKEAEKRSLSEYWEKIKNYFKDFHIELKEKYLKFGEWVKDIASKGLDKAKTKLQNLKQIAREVIDHTRNLSKEVAVEALEFLRPYKEDLGSLWDQVKDTVKEVITKKD